MLWVFVCLFDFVICGINQIYFQNFLPNVCLFFQKTYHMDVSINSFFHSLHDKAQNDYRTCLMPHNKQFFSLLK